MPNSRFVAHARKVRVWISHLRASDPGLGFQTDPLHGGRCRAAVDLHGGAARAAEADQAIGHETLFRRAVQQPFKQFDFLLPLISTSSLHKSPKHLTTPDTMRLETGKDIDRRTNTTVSRPGQFRVALRICGHPPRMASTSAKTGSFAGQTWRTLAACRVGIRAGIVATGSQPVHRGHHCDAPARPKTAEEEDHLLAAAF